MMRVWLVLLLLWLVPIPSLTHAACTGSSPAWTCGTVNDLEALVESNSPGTMQNGDTVNLSAGTFTWGLNQQVNFNSGKNFTLKGAGAGITILQPHVSSGISPIHITTSPGTGPTRVTALTIDGNANTGLGSTAFFELTGYTEQLRIDHLECLVNGPSCFIFYGQQIGVVDHNQTTWVGTGIPYYVHHQDWDGTAGHGDGSWAAAQTFGTSRTIVFENNTWTLPNGGTTDQYHFRFGLDGWFGQRQTFRFNTLNNVVWGMHGMESSGRNRGGMQFEIYGNTFNLEAAPGAGGTYAVANMLGIRGGSFRAFDNIVNAGAFSSTNSIVSVTAENSSDPAAGVSGYTPFGICGRWDDHPAYAPVTLTSSGSTATVTFDTTADGIQGAPDGQIDGLQPYNVSKTYLRITGADQANYNGVYEFTVTGGNTGTYTCAGGAACGPSPATGTIHFTSPWNGNTNAYGNLCIDQVGAGPGDLLSGDVPPPQPTNQALSPAYGWNNVNAGVQEAITSKAPNHIVANEHIYSYTVAFNGSVGVGRGARGSRPANCTTGVAYWSTDGGTNWNTSNGSGVDGALDKCTSTNTWTNDWYVPYTYPHPLIAETEGSPPAATGGALLRGAKGLGLF